MYAKDLMGRKSLIVRKGNGDFKPGFGPHTEVPLKQADWVPITLDLKAGRGGGFSAVKPAGQRRARPVRGPAF